MEACGEDFLHQVSVTVCMKTKDAVAVADQLVTELYCRWGIPEMVVLAPDCISPLILGIHSSITTT